MMQEANVHKKGTKVEFANYYKQLQTPFVIHADFESNLKQNQKLMEIILMHPIRINIKNMFFVVMVTKMYVLMKNVVNQCKYTEVKIQFED